MNDPQGNLDRTAHEQSHANAVHRAVENFSIEVKCPECGMLYVLVSETTRCPACGAAYPLPQK